MVIISDKLQIRISHINGFNRARSFCFRTNKVIYIPSLMRGIKCKECGIKLDSLYILIIKSLYDAELLAENYIDNDLLCCRCYARKNSVEKGKDRKI